MTPPSGSRLPAPGDYRSDIDGLRAIAVLSVMLFHAQHYFLPGGFVGVDIFFVISGFLITKHIANDVRLGRFSLVEFYRRRIRRIMPMMMTVTAATLAVAVVFMTPEDGRDVAKSAVWSVASLANVHFWRDLDTGYFANSSAEVPLLHLWSLGVEEQFYVFWPLLLCFGLKRLRPLAVPLVTGLVALASFQLASSLFDSAASFAYYMLPTRAGELLLGALVGINAVGGHWKPSARSARLIGWAGIAMIAASLVLIDRHLPFPGWSALWPTLGAAMLILAGEHHRQPVPGLSSWPLVFVGKISYSAYLWHWPLFAFFRYGYGEPGVLACAVLLLATLLLAWASFEWVEKPTRGTAAPFRTVALRQFVLPAAAVLLPAFVVVFAARIGLPLESPAYSEALDEVRVLTPKVYPSWVCQRQRLSAQDAADPACVLGAPGGAAPRALLWGDSNAAHYVPMIREIAAGADARFRNFSVGTCPPVFVDPAPYVDARRLADCRSSLQVAREVATQYPLVIMSASWTAYAANSPDFLRDVRDTVRILAANGQSVVLLGKAPVITGYDARCTEKALRVPFRTCPVVPTPLAPDVIAINRQLKALADAEPGVGYFDGNRHLCPDDQCLSQTTDGKPRYLDATHLSVIGSAELGRAVLAGEGMPAALAPMRAASR